MKANFLFFILLISSLYTSAQTYTIPGATEQPAWVFPLWFEDGTGAKDTLYISYDPEAQNSGLDESDIIFGEGFIVLDTSAFFISWGSPYMDTLGKKVVVLNDLRFYIYLSFYKAKFPVKIF